MMKYILLFALAVLVPASYAQRKCPRGYIYFKETFSCHKLIRSRAAWREARNTCQEEGAYLASVHSDKEMKLVKALMRTFRVRTLFLGVYKLTTNADFINVDGTDVDYYDWFNGKMPRQRGKICVSVSRYRSFKWIGFPCTTRIPFMCKFYPDRSLLRPRRQRCYICDHAATNEECNARGKQECPFGADSCQNEIRLSGDRKWITKRCKQKTACMNNFMQNKKAAWQPSQCTPSFSTNSVCRCCCSGDLCNHKELPCLNETACARPAPVPRNAIVTCTKGQQPGSVCKTRCRVGYGLSGNATRRCLPASGTWTKTTQSCKLMKCNSRQVAPSNGSMSCSNSNYYRSRCRFACRKNFALRGRKTLFCGLSRRWNAETPTCQEITCPGTIGTPANGSMVTPSSFTLSSKVSFSCDDGFRINGKSSLTCVDRDGDGIGEWSTQQPSCDIITCPNMPPPEKGEFRNSPPQMVFGSVINTACFPGYFLIGDDNLHCSDADNDGIGEWLGTMATCNLITCPVLDEPRNMKLILPNVPVYASVISITCDEGYFLVGRSNIQCFDSDNDGAGEWNGDLPTCRQITCLPLAAPDNGEFLNPPKQTVYESIIKTQCFDGYFLDGENTVQCVDDNDDGFGEWSGKLPTCKLITCPALDPPNKGEFVDVPTELIFGAVLTTQCFDGYYLIGRSNVQCFDSNNDGIGEWNGNLPTCRLITCLPLDAPENSQLTVPSQLVFGSVVSIECDEGYFRVGRSILQCFDTNNDGFGEWNGELPICRQITCQPLTAPQNGRMVSLVRMVSPPPNHVYGTQVRFECEVKYFLIGSRTLRCGDADQDGEGEWLGNLPSCSLITCPDLNPPENGLFVSIDSAEFGSVLKSGCDDGYLLTGEPVLSCADSNNDGVGAWNASLPTCERIMCLELLAAPNNGDVVVPPFPEWGTLASYSCNPGYFMNGVTQRRCGDQDGVGEWSGLPPTCILIECNEISDPDNGEYIESDPVLKVGTRIEISCYEGFHELTDGVVCSDAGNSSVGEWVGNLPSCVLIECNEIPDPDNGEYLESDSVLKVGTRIDITCSEGFREQINGDVVCSDAGNSSVGKWVGNFPSCAQIECVLLTIPENGDVLCTESNLYGSVCTFSCLYGYWLNGNPTTQCIDNNGLGEWTNPNPTCTRITCSPELSNPVNGSLSCNDSSNIDSECHFSCARGYALSGNDIVTCQDKNEDGVGEWSDDPAICNRISCAPQESPENGGFSCTDGLLYGSKCSFECSDGFALVGADFTFCTDPAFDGTGSWKGIQEFPPFCESISCGTESSDPVNGTHQCSDGARFRSECSYSCEEGYQMIGSPNRDCRADRTWSDEEPTCEILRCKPSPRNPENGFVFCTNGDKYGSTCRYFCDLRYELVGASASICSLDKDGDGFGEFDTDPPVCEAIFCPAIEGPVTGGRVICGLGLPSTDSNRYGSECVLACDNGWIIDGKHRTACYGSGEWSEKLGNCARYNCVPPLLIPAFGSKQCSSRDDTIGTECRFSCQRGTSLEGSDVATCQSDGKWSHQSPICFR